jgi:O-glycosyl hydrolase
MNKSKYALYITPFLALLCAFGACDLGYIGKVADAAEPVIVVQPRSTGVNRGGAASLSVTATLPGNEGTLRYQWYQFTEFSDYQNQTGTPMVNATGSSFTPPSNEEGQFNYYVVVTGENNKVNGRRKNSVKSDSVTFSVNNPDNAWYPSITKQPVGGSVVWSTRMTPPALEVAAEIEEERSDELRYQWYVAPVFTNTQGEAIEGATASRFIPPVAVEGVDAVAGAISGPGSYYYFAVVTNYFFVPGRRESVAVSNPVAVSVILNPNAETPVITAQPQNAIFFTDDTPVKVELAVEVESPTDGGTLSFSWFSNTRSSTTGGTAITTGTNVEDIAGGKKAICDVKSLIDLTKDGTTFYFYVVVTNTNELVSNPRVSVTSRVAEITVTRPYGTDDSNATFTVQLGGTNQYQYVRGFGGMDVAWGNFPDYSVQDYENMYNPDILGYNMLRVMILPGNVNINKTMSDLVSNQIYTSMDRSRFYENVKTVNRYGGYVLASPWSPPAAWKTNNSINGGGSLRPTDYQNYANYLRAFAQNMLNNGAPIYAISIQNEPNYPAGYDGCEWTSKEMSEFFSKVGRFTEGVAGFGGGKIINPVKTMNGESANTTTINQAAMNNPAAKASIDILGRHNYGSRNDNGAGTGATASDNWIYHSDPREVWMTEHNLNSNSGTSYPNDHTWNYIWLFMNDIDMTVRINHEAAFIWWSSKRFYSMIGDGTYGSRDGEIPPRGWGLAHYAKFAKESYRANVTYTGTTRGDQALVEGDNINGSTYANFESTTVKVSAFVKLKGGEVYPVNWRNRSVNVSDIAEITLVMFTPTEANAAGSGGYDMGKVKIQLPTTFKISGATAMRSDKDIFGNNNRGTPRWESVPINRDRNAAYVNLPRSTILSVRFTQ